ncbi:MAG TPA: DUF4347 domain-containing protein, partial [Candidatus Limnocylindria bacterium]|nr:DUF4347 domain-containing protein [Candidatus Limnocylindria bacterium]
MKIWKMCFRWLATCAALTVMVQSVSAAKGRLGVDLIFVDGSVQGYGIIAQSALPGYRVVVLNPERDEMTQISDEFSRMTQNGEQANSVHIVSHGSPGTIRLGAQSISTSTLKGRAAELAAWRAGLSPSASIYLYGCETGAGESGMAYLQEWASLTGASVAASANRTGAGRLGADWTLEVSTGAVESKAAFDLQTLQKLPEVLIDYIFYHDGTAGKLYRSELDGANQTAILTYNGSFSTVAVDFVVADPVNSNLYYNRIFNDVNRGLYKTTFAGASPVRISPNTTNLVSGMSLDLVNNKVYMHDDTAGKWYRMNLDGSGAQVLQTTAGTATFSAVDTKHSVFYYTQTIVGSTRGLYKTDLAMTTAGTQITTAGNQITGVAVDMTHDKIYYHDNTGTAIFQANLDGSSPVNKLTTSANTPVIGITVDHVNQRIYYAGTAGSSFQSLRGVYRTADLDLTTPTRVSTANDLVGPAGVTTIYVAPPSISGVTGPSAGSFNAGDNLDFTVTYDTAVDVTGSPYLPLTVGSSSVNATYSSGTGTTSLVFRYTVQAGDTDSNGIASSSPLVLNGGTIVKASGSTAANLTFTTPTTTSVLVDTTAPTISIGSPSASITAGGPVSYTVTYSDANFQSSTLSAGNITVNTTGSASASSAVVSGSGTTRTVTLSGITGSGTLGISIASGTGSDVAGNLAPGAGPSTTFTVDNTAPTVSIGSPSASLTAGGPVSYTVTYSDANFQSSTLSAGNITVNSTGSASASSVVVSGSGTTRTVTLSGITGNGTLGISIASGTATDLAGNTSGGAGPSTTFTVDNTAPTVSIGSPSASITAGGPISYTVTYSDANFQSSTLSAGNITVNSTGSASASSVVVSGSGTTRTVTLSGITGDGTLGISIASGTATDLAGNTAGAAGPSTTFTVDNTAPTVSIGSPSASVTATGPVNYTVTYSDANFQSSTLSSGDV